MVFIEITSRSKALKSLNTDEYTLDDPVQEIVKEVSEVNHHLSVNRIRITYQDANGKNVPIDTSKTIGKAVGATNDNDKIVLSIKDLGPQLGWRTVFLIEYLGPLLIHPLFYYYFSQKRQLSPTQTAAFWLATLHFAKRELETLFVHKFSNATMPAFNIFKNSSHYWILSGFNMAFFVYGGSSESSVLFHVKDHNTLLIYALVAVWAFAELSNLKTHVTLAGLRSDANSKEYVIPKGYGFDLVSFPNYFFESLGWLVFAVLVGNWSAWIFLVVGAGQMYVWAVQKHKKYLKLFGDDYKKLNRKAMIPYLF